MRLHPFLLLALPVAAFAWGTDGHRIVGVNALPLLDDSARAVVIEILGSDSDTAIGKACSWPDTVRETPQREWSAPMHYVNIPHSSGHYHRERDCANGMCVTEAILKYANELSSPGLDDQQRWRALAWLCHLVGDLHQPLHAGYRDDRGGNEVDVEYKGKPYNLHQFWDRVVIRERLGYGDSWTRPYPDSAWARSPDNWNPKYVMSWTDESHALASKSAYPSSQVINEQFADQSWLIIRQQWQKASWRLAQILNATVGDPGL
jgi:hypothetical protein